MHFLRVIFAFILLNEVIPVDAQLRQNTGRVQLAIGNDDNIFESPEEKVHDQFLQILLVRSWTRTGQPSQLLLNLSAWESVYLNHLVENKYFIQLNGKLTFPLHPNLNVTLNGQTQIKNFQNTSQGYWNNNLLLGVRYRMKKSLQVTVNGFLQNIDFFQGDEFDFYQTAFDMALVHQIQTYFHLEYGFNLQQVTLPNHLWRHDRFHPIHQSDKLFGVQFGCTWQKEIFLRGQVHFAQNQSNFSGLDYHLDRILVTSVFRFHQRLFVRWHLEWERKQYSGGEYFDGRIGIDPELGTGSEGNLDFVYRMNTKFSIIFRTRISKQESIYRNIYFTKKMFEGIVEIKK